MAVKNVEVAQRQTGLVNSEFSPQVAVGLKEKYGTTMINIDGKSQWTTTAYAKLSIPVFHWGKRKKDVGISRAQEETKELERSALQDQVSKELNASWVNVTETSKKLGIIYTTLDIVQESLELNTFSYNEGKLPILDVLSAQASWLQAYTNIVAVNYQYKVALSEYAKTLSSN